MSLNKLIGQKVTTSIEVIEDVSYDVTGTVLSVDVNDHYFYEKNEPIYITVAIHPDNLPEFLNDDDMAIITEELTSVNISKIRKGNKKASVSPQRLC